MVDVGRTAGTVFGIAGMGISLGLLSHVASNLARSTDSMYPQNQRRGLPRRTERPSQYRTRYRRTRRVYNTPSYRGRTRTPAMYQNYWNSW